MKHTPYTLADIDKCFVGCIGQKRSIENAKAALKAYAIGGTRLPSFFLAAAAGMGKTRILDCIGKAKNIAMSIREGTKLTDQVLFFESADAFANLDSNGFARLTGHIEKVRPAAIQIDEVQSLYQGYQGPTKKAFHNFMKQALDAQSANGKHLEFKGLPDPVWVSHTTMSIDIGTNFPDTLDDAAAINRRFNVLRLEPYSVEEIATITFNKLTGLGIHANENTLKLIGRCGRGTCEAPDKISEKLAEIAALDKKKTVNRDDVLGALRSLVMYPRGLNEREVKILTVADGAAVKMSNLGIMLSVQREGIRACVGNLMSQLDETNKPVPLVIERAGSIQTTNAGREYLAALKKEKFNLPR